MKKILLASTLLLSSMTYAAELNIAVVDMNEAVQKSPNMLRIQKRLDESFSSRHSDIMKKINVATTKNEELIKNSSVMAPKDRDALVQELSAMQKEIDSLQSKFQEDYHAKRNTTLKKFYDKVSQVTQQLAKEKGYDLILSTVTVPFADKHLDITADLAKRIQSIKD